MIIIGIDPGFTGAIAFLHPGSNTLEVHDMPVFKGPTGKSEINMRMLAELLNRPIDMAIIEHVSAMPNQGSASTFNFGVQYGALLMCLAGHGIPDHRVRPSQWKKHFGLSKDKGVSRGLATRRFPENAESFQRVKDDGRAEAALIALYGHEKLTTPSPASKRKT